MSRRVAVAASAAALLAACSGTPPAGPADPVAEVPAAVVQYVLETRPSGEVVSWQTKGTTQRGTMTALRTFRGQGGFCRDYALTVSEVDGEGASWQATACRDSDGQWHPMTVAES